MADEAAIPDGNRVDRAEAPGVGGDLVQVLQDQLLARMGDVQPVEAQSVGAGQEFAATLAGKSQFGEVDGAV